MRAVIYEWVRDWQTLITGLLALLAAYFAARPVWRQLTSLQIQSALMERDTLITRVAAIESRRDIAREKIEAITRRLTGGMFVSEDNLDINPAWAEDAEPLVNAVVAILTAHQEASLDGELIDTKRRAVIQHAKELSGCLSDIHAPYSQDFHSPDLEINLTNEQIADAEAKADAAAARAKHNLSQRISAVRKSGDELDVAFKTSLGQLRARIRQIDVRM
jgi:hypothetical protein